MVKKQNSVLDEALIVEVRDALLKQKSVLEKELSQFTSQNEHNLEDYEAIFPDFGNTEEENSAEVATYSDNLSLEHSLETSLRDVNSALKRIENNEYGMCKYCGTPINPDRLRARPASSSCMDCKVRLTGG